MRLATAITVRALLPTIFIIGMIGPLFLVEKASEIIHSNPTHRITTVANEEPSHVAMCRTILERIETTTSFESIIFKESESICLNRDAPFSSLEQMFASSFLSELSSEFGVTYEPDCKQWDKKCCSPIPIQSSLPSPLMSDPRVPIDTVAMFGETTVETLRKICMGCMTEHADGRMTPGCVTHHGYCPHCPPGPGVKHHWSTWEVILTRIKTNFRYLTLSWMNTVNAQNLLFWLRPIKYFVHRYAEVDEVAVIHLAAISEDCRLTKSDCDCFFGIPFYRYAAILPPSVTNINIMAPPYCAVEGSPCMQHATALLTYLTKLYPRTHVEFHSMPSTSSLFIKMVAAHHLIAPPSDFSLMAALVRDQPLTTEWHGITRTSTTIINHPSYSWRIDEIDVSQNNIQILNTYDSICSPTLQSFDDMPIGFCRFLRGRYGHWVQDLDVASQLQYDVAPLEHYYGEADRDFRDTVITEYEPYRPPTTYMWEELIHDTCPITLFSADKFCEALSCMGISRIFFLGDNTVKNQALSLWKLLLNDDDPSDPSGASSPNFIRTIPCADDFELTIEYVRNDKLIENDKPVGPGVPNCGESSYCYPWKNSYLANENNTLLLFSVGMHHLGDYDGFQTAFDAFLTLLDGMKRPNDIVQYRLLVPGHRFCNTPGIAPYANYEEYCTVITDMNDWNEVPLFNDYAVREILKYNDVEDRRGASLEWLDVFFMSILRPDGHLSDCLHYHLPGVPDFWNHLMVDYLGDMCHERTAS